jgi:hypothetical protein
LVFSPVWQSEMIAVMFMVSRNSPNNIFVLKMAYLQVSPLLDLSSLLHQAQL